MTEEEEVIIFVEKGMADGETMVGSPVLEYISRFDCLFSLFGLHNQFIIMLNHDPISLRSDGMDSFGLKLPCFISHFYMIMML